MLKAYKAGPFIAPSFRTVPLATATAIVTTTTATTAYRKPAPSTASPKGEGKESPELENYKDKDDNPGAPDVSS